MLKEEENLIFVVTNFRELGNNKNISCLNYFCKANIYIVVSTDRVLRLSLPCSETNGLLRDRSRNAQGNENKENSVSL